MYKAMSVMTQPRPALRSCFTQVLDRAAAGDRDAWCSLYDAVNPGLLRYLAASAGPAVGEEILADTFLELGRNLSSFHGGRSEFRVHAFSVGRRRMLDRRRFEPQDATTPPSAVSAQAYRIAQFAASVACALSPDQAEAVLLCVCGRLLIAEAAQVLGTPVRSVATLAQSGLWLLDDFLGSPEQQVGARRGEGAEDGPAAAGDRSTSTC